MRTRITILVLAATAALAGGCGAVESAVDEATERVEGAVETARYCVHAIEVAEAVNARDVDAAVEAGERLVEVAPEEIRPDAQIVLEAAREARDGNPAALQSDQVQQAAERLRRATQETCNPAS